MRIQSLVLFLSLATPGLALRGEHSGGRFLRIPISSGPSDTAVRQSKEVDGAKDSKEPKEVASSKEPKVAKEEKESKKEKKDDEKTKKSKKDKKDKKDKNDKKCKKAKKDPKPKRPSDRRYAEVIKEDEIDADAVVDEDDTEYCLHSKQLSSEQCLEVKEGNAKLAKDGSIKGGLNIELFHKKEQTTDEILESVNGILSRDTNPRYVGCEDLKAPPKPKSSKKSKDPAKPKENEGNEGRRLARRTRRAHRRHLEEYTIVDKKEDMVDVTGVDFADLKIVPGGCNTARTNVFQDMVCDIISSSVEIFYVTNETVSEEDEEDMYNLLVETIYAQAEVGSFNSLGNVTKVEVSAAEATNDRGMDGDGEDLTSSASDPSGEGNTFENHKVPILAAAAGFAALFAGGYWYAMGSDEQAAAEEKNEHTDDSDSDDERRVAAAQ